MKVAESFSTRHVPPGQREQRWTEAAFDRFVELDFRILNQEEFLGSMLNRDVAKLSLTHILSAGHALKRITRTRRQAARAAEAFFLLSLQLEGGCKVRQGAREAGLEPGFFAIYDTTRPYELVLEEDYRQVVLRIPRAALTARLPGCDALTAIAVPTGEGPNRLLLQMLQTICAEAQHWSPAVALDVSDALVAILAGGLRSFRDTGLPAPLHSGEAQVARIKAYVLAHLGDPDLGVATIAAALGLSPGHLHRLFRNESTTLDRWIWMRRLDTCRRALADAGDAQRGISEIAFACGFSDAAHFSRSFRQRFGISPREHRRAVLAAAANQRLG